MKHALSIAHPIAVARAVRLITASPGWPAAKRWRETTDRMEPMMVCGREKFHSTFRGVRTERFGAGDEEEEEERRGTGVGRIREGGMIGVLPEAGIMQADAGMPRGREASMGRFEGMTEGEKQAASGRTAKRMRWKASPACRVIADITGAGSAQQKMK
mmetsp:Transcript_14829/g.36038  ORF Transcript_14829/g.36038 Transcript_14829/m.36038 type:complete len:158 (+) Transcript_14829:604-1077(+)